MDATAVIAMIGGIALLIGIFGGGLKAKEVEIPQIPKFIRILSSLTGIALLGIAIWLSIRSAEPVTTPAMTTLLETTTLPNSSTQSAQQTAAAPTLLVTPSATMNSLFSPTRESTSTTDPAISGRNIAQAGTVEASSSHDAPCYLPENAVDDVLSEWPTPQCGSWATRGELAGAWIKVTFDDPRLITAVILYDRTNPNDQVLAGRLEFSDGTQIAVGTLPNGGAPFPVTFPEKRITWVRFVVERAQGLNIGLTEIQIYGQ